MIQARSRIGLIVAALCVLALGLHTQSAHGATSDQGASWLSAPAQPPATPLGAQPPPYPVPIGYVGDIQFWAPNRGLLITAGNSVVPEGLYAYDGVSWHQLSTVCGGTDGRIAWAGPDEFWTIADQRPGQVLPSGGVANLENVSLCHFLNGQVVASYAMPLDQQDSYQTMNAAACDSSADCWFGGAVGSSGAFHLHWNGTMTEVDGPQNLEIAAMAVHNGQIYESVQLNPNTDYGSVYTPVLHLIAPSDATNPFHNLYPDNEDPNCGLFCPPLPEYGADTTGTAAVPPQALSGFALSSDSSTGAIDPQLWAAAGIDQPALPDGGSPYPIVMLYADGAWTQVVGAPNPNPNPTSPNLSLPDGEVPVSGLGQITPVAQTVAAEPNEAEHAAWVAVLSPGDTSNNAHVLRIQVSGVGTANVTAAVTDNDTLGLPQGVAPAGPASAISCPAAADCWLATNEGWLFHLTDGTPLAQDTDPNFAGVINYRPPDGGTPAVIPPVELGQSLPPPPIQTPTQPPTRHKKARPLVTHVRAHLIHRTVLVLSFTLTAKAHVQLIGRRHGQIVARSKHPYLKKGRHELKLHLNPKHWPTKLALDAVPVGASGGRGSGGGGNVTTS